MESTHTGCLSQKLNPPINKSPLDYSTDHCSHLSSSHLFIITSTSLSLLPPSPTNSLPVYVPLIFTGSRYIFCPFKSLPVSICLPPLFLSHVWVWEQPRGASIFPGQCSSRLEWRPLSLLFTASLIPQQLVCVCCRACVWRWNDCRCLDCNEVCLAVLPLHFFWGPSGRTACVVC